MKTTKYVEDKSIPVWWVKFKYIDQKVFIKVKKTKKGKKKIYKDSWADMDFFVVKGKYEKVDWAFRIMKKVLKGMLNIDGKLGDKAFDIIKDKCFQHPKLTVKHRLSDKRSMIISLD